MFQWAKAHFFVEIDAAEGQRPMIATREVRREGGRDWSMQVSGSGDRVWAEPGC